MYCSRAPEPCSDPTEEDLECFRAKKMSTLRNCAKIDEVALNQNAVSWKRVDLENVIVGVLHCCVLVAKIRQHNSL